MKARKIAEIWLCEERKKKGKFRRKNYEGGSALSEQGRSVAPMMPGTGCCSIMETVKLTAQAVEHGCAGVLTLPPLYYKDVSDEGLYRYLSEVAQRVGNARLKIYLYHIPPFAVIGIITGLVEHLLAAYLEEHFRSSASKPSPSQPCPIRNIAKATAAPFASGVIITVRAVEHFMVLPHSGRSFSYGFVSFLFLRFRIAKREAWQSLVRINKLPPFTSVVLREFAVE